VETLSAGRSSLYPREHILELLDDLPQDRDRDLYRERNVVGSRQIRIAADFPGEVPTLTSSTGMTLVLKPSAASCGF